MLNIISKVSCSILSKKKVKTLGDGNVSVRLGNNLALAPPPLITVGEFSYFSAFSSVVFLLNLSVYVGEINAELRFTLLD